MTAKKTSPLTARKRPARLALAGMRTGLPWSDGKKVIEGEELVVTRRKIAVGLAGMKETRATAAEMHKSNSMQLLRMFRKHPIAHGLPDVLGPLLLHKAVELHAAALKGIPGSKEHLITFRRLAKRMGSLGPRDLLLDGERQAINQAIRETGHVRLRSEITAVAALGRHTAEVVLPKGTSLELEALSDGRDFVMTEGTRVRIASEDLGKLKPCRRPAPSPDLVAEEEPSFGSL